MNILRCLQLLMRAVAPTSLTFAQFEIASSPSVLVIACSATNMHPSSVSCVADRPRLWTVRSRARFLMPWSVTLVQPLRSRARSPTHRRLMTSSAWSSTLVQRANLSVRSDSLHDSTTAITPADVTSGRAFLKSRRSNFLSRVHCAPAMAKHATSEMPGQFWKSRTVMFATITCVWGTQMCLVA